MTKQELFALLGQSNNGRGPTVISVNGIRGYVSSVEREDGSGESFNITLNDIKTGAPMTVYLRCDPPESTKIITRYLEPVV